MRAHPLLCLALLALASCATADKSTEATSKSTEATSRQEAFQVEFARGSLCPPSPCTVKITVAPGCVVTVDPPILGIDTSLRDVGIKWVIERTPTNQATFARLPRHGINPKAGSVIGWRQEFRNPDRVSDTEFTWEDRNKLPGGGGPRKRPHDYEIEMVQDGRRCHVDPIIINDY